MKSYELNTPTTQRGAVLIVSLLILMIMTIIGVSTLNTTTLQEQMAANTANKYKTYHAAESAIATTIANKEVFLNAVNTNENNRADTINYDDDEFGDHVAAHVDLYNDLAEDAKPTYMEGFSLGLFVATPFVITGRSTFGESGARSTHVQGVSVLTPAP